MEMISLRDQVGPVLCECFDERMAVIDADLSKSTSTAYFQARHPEQFLEIGISEGSGVSIATGLSREGLLPFYVNFALFCTGSAWTQLRQACYGNANIKLIGTHPGLDNGPDGPTHHATEDLALARALPNLTVLVPGSRRELAECVRLAMAVSGPVYIRVARAPMPELPIDAPFTLGRAAYLCDEGSDFGIVYEGTCTGLVVEALNALRERGLRGKALNLRSIKPLDAGALGDLAASVGRLVTVENHSLIGGVYGAVAETLCARGGHPVVRAVGVPDCFTESAPVGALREAYGLSAAAIVRAVTE